MSSASAETRRGSRSRQACLNCRRKKVKCNGELPSCSFCARLLQQCVYSSRRRTITSVNTIQKSTNYDDLASRIALIESQLGRIGPSQESGVNMQDLASLIGGASPTTTSYHVSQTGPRGLHAAAQSTIPTTLRPSTLPPFGVLIPTVDLYFDNCHNQPYCFFHEETFRQHLSNHELPEYLVMAVLVIAVRFSRDPFYINNDHHTASRYASEAWKEIVRLSFDSEESLDYRLVQAATLLALHDFTAGQHGKAWIKIGLAVSMAQALHLMNEPSAKLPFSAQEERRRTLWSIYMLDKMATCGRYRPSLFLDRTIQLQLPCNEQSFRTSTPEQVVTLDNFPSLIDTQIGNLQSLAPTVALVSILSQAANYAFEHNKTNGQKPPWDHTSEYQHICSQLTRFETFFDCYGDVQQHILNGPDPQHGVAVQITEFTIFSYVLYHLCYCLLQHPFLLRHRLEKSGIRIPTSFLAQTISSCSSHAQELTRTLTNAKLAQYKTSATFFSYTSLVAGSLHCLFQHSPDVHTSIQSAEALQSSLAHLKEKSQFWQTSARMFATLSKFSDASARYSRLLDPSLQLVSLDPVDIERLYMLCDYGTISTNHIVDSQSAVTAEPEPNHLIQPVLTQERSPTLEHEDYSSHIDGIIPQLFGHTDAGTMLENFSFALGDLNGSNLATASHFWRC